VNASKVFLDCAAAGDLAAFGVRRLIRRHLVVVRIVWIAGAPLGIVPLLPGPPVEQLALVLLPAMSAVAWMRRACHPGTNPSVDCKQNICLDLLPAENTVMRACPLT
jgi:hypothetical protein